MTAREMGEVFEYLLKYREVSAEPMYRSKRPDEARIARILEDSIATTSLQVFEDFLRGQGFALNIFDPTYFGKDRKSSFYVLIRAGDAERPALYINRNWFDHNFIHGQRKKETKDERIVWGIQLWLILQYLLYTRHDRTVHQVSLFDRATVGEIEFSAAVNEFIEKLRRQSRPDGERGREWDILTAADKKAIEWRTNKFLTLMVEAGMLMRAGEDSGQQIYRQTVLAATELSFNVTRGIDYLKPPEGDEKITTVQDVLKGYLSIEDENVTNQ